MSKHITINFDDLSSAIDNALERFELQAMARQILKLFFMQTSEFTATLRRMNQPASDGPRTPLYVYVLLLRERYDTMQEIYGVIKEYLGAHDEFPKFTEIMERYAWYLKDLEDKCEDRFYEGSLAACATNTSPIEEGE